MTEPEDKVVSSHTLPRKDADKKYPANPLRRLLRARECTQNILIHESGKRTVQKVTASTAWDNMLGAVIGRAVRPVVVPMLRFKQLVNKHLYLLRTESRKP